MTYIMKTNTVYYLKKLDGTISEDYILDGTYFEYGEPAGLVETDGTFRYYFSPQDSEFEFTEGDAGFVEGLSLVRTDGRIIQLIADDQS